MNKLLIVLLIAFSLHLFSCKKVEVSYYPNGMKKSEICYQGNKKNGKALWWLQNGVVSAEGVYKNDYLEGIYMTFYGNSNLHSRTEFVKGKKEGLSRLYDEDGDLVSEYTYNKDTLNGKCKIFHSNGFISQEGFYKNGMYDSVWTYRDENNIKIGEGVFKYGSGVLRYWLPDGTLMREVNYKNNVKDGPEIIYDYSGILRQQKNYKQGKLEGIINF